MRIVAEARWDLDEKRRVCIELSADGVEPENAAEVAVAVAEAVTVQAAQAYAVAKANHPEITGKPGAPATFQD